MRASVLVPSGGAAAGGISPLGVAVPIPPGRVIARGGGVTVQVSVSAVAAVEAAVEAVEQSPEDLRTVLTATAATLVEELAELALALNDPGEQLASALVIAMVVLVACRIVTRRAGGS